AAGALLDAWEWTQEAAWLERARRAADVMVRRFATPSGALADRPTDEPGHGALATPYLPIADAPTPSGHGAAALALQRLHAITGEAKWLEQASAILRAFGASAGRLTSSAATWMKALSWSVRPVTTVVVVGEPADEATGMLLAEALKVYRPRTV